MSKMLIVDDSATDREFLTGVLERMGHTVLTADSGVEGLALAETNQPAVVFMDIMMANMDGFSATREMNAKDSTNRIPIVIVSCKNQRADKVWAKLQGAKGYIVKPYSAEDVAAELQKLSII